MYEIMDVLKLDTAFFERHPEKLQRYERPGILIILKLTSEPAFITIPSPVNVMVNISEKERLKFSVHHLEISHGVMAAYLLDVDEKLLRHRSSVSFSS